MINRLATIGVDLQVLDMPVDAQDVARGGQLVALVTAGVAAIERANISRRTKQGLERAWAEGKLAGRRWNITRAWMHTIQRIRKDLGMSLARSPRGQGVSESLVRRVLKVRMWRRCRRLPSKTAVTRRTAKPEGGGFSTPQNAVCRCVFSRRSCRYNGGLIQVLQRRFKGGMRGGRHGLWRESSWPASSATAPPVAVAATHPARTAAGAASHAPPSRLGAS